MDVRLPDGTIVRGVPDGMSQTELIGVLEKNGHDVTSLKSHSAFSPKDQAKEAGANMPKWQRGLTSIAQGPLFGFADEIGGAVGAALGAGQGETLGERYRNNRDMLRGGASKFEDEHPVLSTIGQVGASLPLGAVGLAARVLPAARGMVGAARNAGIAGAGTGAVGGAGTAEEMGDVAGGAAFGALTGGVLSAGAQPVMGAVSGGWRNARARDAQGSGGGGGGMVPALLRSENAADDLAKQSLARALARDKAAIGDVSSTLSRLGPDAPLAVGAGRNTVRLLDTTATAPGRTIDAVEDVIRNTQRNEFSRFESGARNLMGNTGQRLNDTVETLIAQRKAASDPIYERVRQVAVEADEDLAKVIADARDLGADRIGARIAKADGRPFTLADVTASRPGPLGVGTVPGTKLSMSDLDYLKQGIDDLVKKHTDPSGKVSAEGASLIRLRERLLGKLDPMTADPKTGRSIYKDARDAFAGPSALIDAAEAGKRAFNMDAVGIDKALRGMSQSEIDAFRIGAWEALRNKMGGRGGRTELVNTFQNNNLRERLQLLFPDVKSVDDFERLMADAGRIRAVESVGRGSKTAERNAGMDDEGMQFLGAAADMVGAAKSGGLLGMGTAAANLYRRATMPEPVRDRIGEMLLRRGPEAQSLLGDLSRYVEQENQRRAAAAARGGLLGGAFTTSILGQ